MPDRPLPSLFDDALPEPSTAGGSGRAGSATAPMPAAEAADGKAPDALRTIGEVATALGIRQHVLRYWEEQFPMLRPLKRSGGRRYYRPADVAMLERIDRLVHREGYTLRGARLVLQGKGAEAAAERAGADDQPVAQPVAAGVAANGERLRAIRARLAAALG
jgi:DNA-binding transcriptional MerR regulator